MDLNTETSSLFSVYLILTIILIVGAIFLYSYYLNGVKNANKVRNEFFRELEDERRSIASEIHDTLGGFLVPLKQMIYESGSFESTEMREHWNKLIEKYQTDMTFSNSKIYPVELEENDLYKSLEALSTTFSSKTCFIEVTIDEKITLTPLECIHIYRIIQESIVNAVKHCVPTYIQVLVTSDGARLLSIALMYPSNETTGAQRVSKKGRRGQRILSERLSFVGGTRVILCEDGFATEEFNFNLTST